MPGRPVPDVERHRSAIRTRVTKGGRLREGGGRGAPPAARGAAACGVEPTCWSKKARAGAGSLTNVAKARRGKHPVGGADGPLPEVRQRGPTRGAAVEPHDWRARGFRPEVVDFNKVVPWHRVCEKGRST